MQSPGIAELIDAEASRKIGAQLLQGRVTQRYTVIADRIKHSGQIVELKYEAAV